MKFDFAIAPQRPSTRNTIILVGLALTAAIVMAGGHVGLRLRAVGTIGPRTIVTIIVIIALAALFYWLVFRVHRLPLSLLGLSDATHIPAIPVWLSQLPGTAFNLAGRARQLTQAVNGLSTMWTIGELPNIARFGLAYNLIILRRVGADDPQFKTELGSDSTARMEQVWQAGNLYVIDMRLFARFPAMEPAGAHEYAESPFINQLKTLPVRLRA